MIEDVRSFSEIEGAYELAVYPKRPLTIVRGENARVWDDAGREYIDCVSGHGVANIGHANPDVIAAVERQARRLITLSNVFSNDQRALLLEKLVEITPPGLRRAFLCNSGAESVEAALKLARFTTKRTEFVCAQRSFHGRTFGALSATFKREYREPFEPLVPGFRFVPFDDPEKLGDAVGENTAGVLLEPIQGESGVHAGSAAYFRKARELCDERGALLILDEVQTGFCRTGAMFACELLGVEPDILCLAKALAGGLPMGAVVVSDRVEAPTGRHGSTFGGNPLSCAAALAAIDFMVRNDLAAQAREKGERLGERLRAADLPVVREIRQTGLMIAIELREKAVPKILQLMEAGLLTFPAGPTTVRIYPPLTIERELLDEVGDRLVACLEGPQGAA